MASSSKGSSYWVVQIAVCAVAAIGLPALGVLLFSLSPEEPGRGLLLILIGIAFLVVLIRLVWSYRRMSPIQRAIYAWAITQRRVEVPLMTPRRTNADLKTLSIAARARDGKLSPAELEGLKALDPTNPYPGPPTDTTSGPPSRDRNVPLV